MNLSKDKEYSHYIKKLFYKELKIKLRESVQIKKNSLTLYFISKELLKYLNNFLHIPLSPKILSEIPDIYKNNNLVLIAFIRGLFDTDGCIILQKDGKYNYILIRICTKFYDFAKDISYSLTKLEIRNYICKKESKGHVGYDVTVRHKNAVKFMKIIVLII